MKKVILTSAAALTAFLMGCSEGSTASVDLNDSSSGDTSNPSLNNGVVFGTLLDVRDSQVYRTVKIDTLTWMADNLNLEYSQGSAKSYCYDNDTLNCRKYGRLYTWSAAMDSAAIYSDDGYGCGYRASCGYLDRVQGICPDGWRLPTDDELYDFKQYGAAAIQARGFKNWPDATNKTGFSVIPSGLRNEKGRYEYLGEYAYIWSKQTTFSNYRLRVSDINVNVDNVTDNPSMSVRCVNDGKSRYVIPYGTMKDERDGQEYKTVKIGKQRWMAQNLNLKYDCSSLSEKKCFVVTPHNGDKKELPAEYGKLYSWFVAMDYAAVYSKDSKACNSDNQDTVCIKEDSQVRGICPKGWHLPSVLEWEDLIKYVGEDAHQLQMRKLSSWSTATNYYGFSALPANYWQYPDTYDIVEENSSTFYWTSSEYHTNGAAYRAILKTNVLNVGWEHTSYAFSVRCIENY